MTICIMHEAGTYFTDGKSVPDVLHELQNDVVLRVWWCSSNGQRYYEDMWFNPELVAAVRTERDDG